MMTSPHALRCRINSLLEGAGWLILYWAAQGGTMLALLTTLIWVGYGSQWPEPQELLNFVLEIHQQQSFLLIGATTLGALFFILPAIWIRFGIQTREYLELAPLRRDQLVFVVAMIVPVAILGDAVHQVALDWWSALIAQTQVGQFWAQSSVEQLNQAFHGVPFYILVVAVALGPAVGEELVFRGAIGKRLISAWGVPLGILFTSLFFGLAHVSPPHVIATVPIAIIAHLLYLHCRSIWAPILLHFGNNLLAVSSVKFSFITEFPLTVELILGALAYLGLLAVAWHINERQFARLGS